MFVQNIKQQKQITQDFLGLFELPSLFSASAGFFLSFLSLFFRAVMWAFNIVA